MLYIIINAVFSPSNRRIFIIKMLQNRFW